MRVQGALLTEIEEFCQISAESRGAPVIFFLRKKTRNFSPSRTSAPPAVVAVAAAISVYIIIFMLHATFF
jgi:hypothetical protein